MNRLANANNRYVGSNQRDRLSAFLLFEEMNIYPYIAEHLSNEDWENISALIPDYEDPIFGDKVRNLRVPSSKGFSIGIWTTTHRQISS